MIPNLLDSRPHPVSPIRNSLHSLLLTVFANRTSHASYQRTPARSLAVPKRFSRYTGYSYLSMERGARPASTKVRNELLPASPWGLGQLLVTLVLQTGPSYSQPKLRWGLRALVRDFRGVLQFTSVTDKYT